MKNVRESGDLWETKMGPAAPAVMFVKEPLPFAVTSWATQTDVELIVRSVKTEKSVVE